MFAWSLTFDKVNVIYSMMNANIQTINVYSYMVKEDGGVENMVFTKCDYYNYINIQKMMLIETRDSQSVVSYFKHMVN